MSHRDVEGEYIARDAREVLGLIRASKPAKVNGHSDGYTVIRPPSKGRDYDEELGVNANSKAQGGVERPHERLFQERSARPFSSSGEQRFSSSASTFATKMDGDDPLLGRRAGGHSREGRSSRERRRPRFDDAGGGATTAGVGGGEAALLEKRIQELEDALERERGARQGLQQTGGAGNGAFKQQQQQQQRQLVTYAGPGGDGDQATRRKATAPAGRFTSAASSRASSYEDEDDDDDDDDDGSYDDDDLSQALERWCPSWLWRVLAVAVYYMCGVWFYASSDTQWPLSTALYFISISITTVGYGDFSPSTARDKVFTMVFVTVGMVVVYGAISTAIQGILKSITARIEKQIEHKDLILPKDDSDVAKALQLKRLFFGCLLFVLMLLGALAMSTLTGMDFVDSLYWAFQTTATVGYGDCALESEKARLFAAAYALTSVGALSGVFEGMTAAKAEAKAERHFRSLLRHPLDPEMLGTLDRDRDGVDRAEFVVGMLVAMNCCDERSVNALMARSNLELNTQPAWHRFDELDSDGSGKLDSQDIQGLIQAHKAKGRNVAATDSKH